MLEMEPGIEKQLIIMHCLTPLPAVIISIIYIYIYIYIFPDLDPGRPKNQKKITKHIIFWGGPGCFGGCRGVVPELLYGIFKGF